jgi:hypothetical protein
MPLLDEEEDPCFRSECGDAWRRGNGDGDKQVVDEEVEEEWCGDWASTPLIRGDAVHVVTDAFGRARCSLVRKPATAFIDWQVPLELRREWRRDRRNPKESTNDTAYHHDMLHFSFL